MGIPIGAELAFTSRDNITVTVVDGGGRVSYRIEDSDEEKEFSISRLTKDLLDYGRSPALCWTYKGRLLREISDEVHGWDEG